MYSIKLDVNKFFTGTYAKVGKVDGGVDIPTLPPTEDSIKALAYKYCTHTKEIEKSRPKTEIVPILNEDGTPKLDESGNPINDLVVVTDQLGNVVTEIYTEAEEVTDWLYDKPKHDSILESIASAIPPITIEEEVVQLRERCTMLDQTLATLMEETLPAIIERTMV